LASLDDRAGRLLREADQAFRSQLSPEVAWNRFQSRRRRRWLLGFAAFAAGAGLIVAFARERVMERPSPETATLVAEQLPPGQPSSLSPRLPEASELAEASERRLSPAPPANPSRLAPSSARSKHNGPNLGAADPLADGPLPADHAAPEALNAPAMTDVTCRGWASQAQPGRAVDCYLTLGRQSGVGAEVALYEAARLSAEALGDAPRALTLLEQHSARFPNSVLRVEVEWLKIRSLERAGRLDEALSASEVLLDSPVGRSLAPQLHLLRGRIYAGPRHECARALPEYVALLGEPNAAGDEAEFKRAQCLEQLQRPDEARAAYQRYLERADARSAGTARARLLAIPTSAHPSEEQR